MLSSRLRSKFRTRRDRCQDRAAYRMMIEPLENRIVLSTITWVNRGQISDGFDSVFAGNAATARAVIDATLDSWERTIVDFNYPGGGNAFLATISMANSGTGHGGVGGVSAVSSDFKPTSGSLTLSRGNDLTGDGLGDGGGYFLDPTPLDWSEFGGGISNVFVGNAPAGSPANGLADFYTLAIHEIGHMMGFEGRTDLAIHSRSTATGILDASGVGQYYVFNGPSIDHVNTSRNGNSQSPVTFVHSADALANFTYNSTNYRGVTDLMNPFYSGSQRKLIPDTMALMLQDGYGYTMEIPQRFGTFHAMLNHTTGELLIRGGGGSSADMIELYTLGNDLVVNVDLGNDVPGTGALPGAGDLPAFVSRFELSRVSSVRVEAGEGNDTVRVWSLPAGLTSVSIAGEGGDDVIDVGHSAGNASAIQSDMSVDGGTGFDTINYQDSISEFPPSFTYDIYHGQLQRSLGPTAGYTNMEQVNVRARGGGNTINVHDAGAPLSVYAGAGNDSLHVDPTSHIFSLSSPVTVFGEGGVDELFIHDENFGGSATYTIDASRMSDSFGNQVDYFDWEQASLHTGSGQNNFLIDNTAPGTPVAIHAGGGVDIFEIDPTSRIFSLGAPVTIDGEGGMDQLIVYDEFYSGNLTYHVEPTALFDSFGNLVNYFGLEHVSLNTGAGENTVLVSSTASGTPLAVNTGDGNDWIDIQETGTSAAVHVDAGSGTDVVLVNSDDIGNADVRFDLNQTLAELIIGAGGTVFITPGSETVLQTQLLHITSPVAGVFTGTLDIADGGIIVDYPTGGPSPLEYHASQIRHARNAGSPMWTAGGITSSLAMADPTRLGVGYAEAQLVLPGGGNFMGGSLPPGEDAVLIRLALNGDANLDDVVDGQDFIVWNTHKFQSGKHWFDGDFNLDTVTDGQDFIIWNQNKFTFYPRSAALSDFVPMTVNRNEPTGRIAIRSQAEAGPNLFETAALHDAVFANLA